MNKPTGFTYIYLAIAVAFAVIGFTSGQDTRSLGPLSFSDAILVALVAFFDALFSVFPFWLIDARRGKQKSLIGSIVLTLVFLGVQMYGFISGRFGINLFWLGLALLMAVYSIEYFLTLKATERAGTREPTRDTISH